MPTGDSAVTEKSRRKYYCAEYRLVVKAVNYIDTCWVVTQATIDIASVGISAHHYFDYEFNSDKLQSTKQYE
jgi:hypothetical protein